MSSPKVRFLSTSPLRGTTLLPSKKYREYEISIHVPLAGDDLRFVRRQVEVFVFLSTSPLRGTTRCATASLWRCRIFLSTSPLRGTTLIEILTFSDTRDFYPRPPCGGRQAVPQQMISDTAFLSTSPLRGTTAIPFHVGMLGSISIHVPLAGDDAAPAATSSVSG